jgi:diguanylate cyclase (GGDEF)-like protein
VALLFLDLDHFKRVNDLYGRDGGDEALRKVAATLRGVVRTTDTVARLSGDEFVVVLGDVRDSETTATVIARLISERLATALHVEHRDVPISASIGISLYPADGVTSDHLLRNADMAMHSAKAAGRHTSRFYSPDLGARAAERVQLEADLRDALAAGQFRLVYQPQFNMLTGGVIGAEALIRWRHPARGDVSPQQFIPLAEETGLIVDIGAWVLRTACREAAAWVARSPKRIAVNISAIQLHRGDFVDLVTDVLDETGLDPRRLDLEITESILLADKGDALTRLTALREIGITLTLDDFGTGYSNLGYLTRFPIDRLKIDRSFVQGLPNERSPASIVGAIIGLSRGLRLDLIAEGVETAEQASFLLEAGCEKAQGFFLSLPLPPEEMTELLAGAERGDDSA